MALPLPSRGGSSRAWRSLLPCCLALATASGCVYSFDTRGWTGDAAGTADAAATADAGAAGDASVEPDAGAVDDASVPPAPTRLSLAGPALVVAGDCTLFTVSTLDATGASAPVQTAAAFELATPGAGAFFGASDSTCSGPPVAAVAFAAGESSATVAFRDARAEQTSIGVSDPAGALAPAALPLTVACAPADHLEFLGEHPADPSAVDTELAIRIAIHDPFHNTLDSGPDATADVSLQLTAGSGALAGITSTPAAAGLADFGGKAVRVDTVGPGKVITATKAPSPATASLSVASAPFEAVGTASWTGSLATARWVAQGATPGAGASDGAFDHPTGLAVDPSARWLYVVEREGARLNKFDLVNGAYLGWVGRIRTSPTGGAPGCAGAPPGSATPGWCVGGAALRGDEGGDGSLELPTSVHADSTWVYVTSLNGTLERYAADTGAWAGWVGRVAVTPSGPAPGGPVGCSSVSPGAATPGWCLGGSAMGSGAGDGMLDVPVGLDGDASWLYVVEAQGARISRFAKADGSFGGWLGRVASAPTATAPGSVVDCTRAAAGSFTGGWCFGGTAQPGSDGDGSISRTWSFAQLSHDGTFLYLADTQNVRISRYTIATGQFEGWIGAAGGTAPTGGAAGCAGLAAGAPTPGWCLGGTSRQAGNLTGFWSPEGVLAAGPSLFATDGPALIRIDRTTGAFDAWLGRIGAWPPQQLAPCAGKPAGTFSAAWCLDGHSDFGSGDGMLDSATGLAADGTHLFVADEYNHRVARYSTDTGAFAGAIGAAATAAAGWVTAGNPAGGYDDSSFYRPAGLSAAGGRLFVLDDGRLRWLELGSAAPRGWVGAAGYDAPTGGAGCTGLSRGAPTPGWCIGGRAAAMFSSGNASLSPADGMAKGVAFDGAFVYVADVSRVARYEASSGAFFGWIGRLGAAATASAPGNPRDCTAAAAGTATPGWCLGGQMSPGGGEGELDAVEGLYVSGGYLHVADYFNSRVQRFRASDGAFAGWIGLIRDRPTGGEPGCASAAPGSVTPGWCVGGSPETFTEDLGDGRLPCPSGVTGDGTFLYVADECSGQLDRYDQATGAFRGWVGTVDLTPTGAAAGGSPECATTPAGSITPGWCVGGRSRNGVFSSADAAFADGRAVYVLQDQGDQLVKVDGASGRMLGWKGDIALPPTGGDPGCDGAPAGTFTPGWCSGGAAALGGAGAGSFFSARGIAGWGNLLYIGDTGNHRVVRIAK